MTLNDGGQDNEERYLRNRCESCESLAARLAEAEAFIKQMVDYYSGAKAQHLGNGFAFQWVQRARLRAADSAPVTLSPDGTQVGYWRKGLPVEMETEDHRCGNCGMHLEQTGPADWTYMCECWGP